MPYTKPHTFVDNNTLDASGINSNDEDLQKFVNQEVVQADIADETLGTEELQRGEYQPITNQYTFTTGIVAGGNNGVRFSDRAYFTSTTKKTRQTEPNLEHWHSLYESAPSLFLESVGDVLITFGGTFISEENEIVDKGYWDSKVMLGYTKGESTDVTFIEETRAYSFEETVPTSSFRGQFSPFGSTSKPSSNGDENDEIKYGCRRWIGFSHLAEGLTPGHYKFSLYINSKVEQGFSSARSYKAEVFYK